MARMKLDAAPLTPRKFALKAAKHGVWIAIALWTGFTFVGYFTPIRELWDAVPAFATGPWETFWVLFYGFATYGNAGWMREQVCKHMCPYARFQSAMFDKDTLIITYDPQRGEPRGKGEGKGHCVDCSICVQVCPTGIDIRDGLQYECIGCAACIDGCDKVMEKVGYPKGLIRYDTQYAMEKKLTRAQMFKRAFRPRVLVYSALLWAIIIGAGVSLWNRVPLKVDVIRDRAALSREVEGGQIENVYRLQIMNTTEASRTYEIDVGGLEHLEIHGPEHVEVGPASSRTVPVRVRLHAEREHIGAGTYPIEFEVEAEDHPQEAVREKSVFIVR
jgi:cytochrome c oxidase accessory protein FixG